jgi:glucose-6-phosphate isomerase
MNDANPSSWDRFQKHYFPFPSIELSVDLSRIDFPSLFWEEMAPRMKNAFVTMTALENGAIANPDEGRRVGHYWLRSPALAPDPKIRAEIENTLGSIHEFAAAVHLGQIRGSDGPYQNLLLIGIGVSLMRWALPTTTGLKYSFSTTRTRMAWIKCWLPCKVCWAGR